MCSSSPVVASLYRRYQVKSNERDFAGAAQWEKLVFPFIFPFIFGDDSSTHVAVAVAWLTTVAVEQNPATGDGAGMVP